MQNIALMRPQIDEDLCSFAVGEVFKTGMLTEGTVSDAFEQALSERWEDVDVALTNSGTSALALAAHVCDIQAGDEVVTTPMTCMATNVVFSNRGANLNWMDVNPYSGMPDLEHVTDAVTEKTKAVVLVWWAGHPPAQMGQIQHFCEERGIPVIIDAAHAISSTMNGSHVAFWGDYVCFSFQAVKHLCCGDGGAIVSHRGDIDRIRKLRWYGLDRKVQTTSRWDQQIAEEGYKMHMNNINAAIGMSNLVSLDQRVALHNHQASVYDEWFHHLSVGPPELCNSSYWIYSMHVPERDSFQTEMANRGIHTDRVHVRNDVYDCYQRFAKPLPGVAKFDRTVTHLPLGPHVSPQQLQYVIESAKEVLGEFTC